MAVLVGAGGVAVVLGLDGQYFLARLGLQGFNKLEARLVFICHLCFYSGISGLGVN